MNRTLRYADGPDEVHTVNIFFFDLYCTADA